MLNHDHSLSSAITTWEYKVRMHPELLTAALYKAWRLPITSTSGAVPVPANGCAARRGHLKKPWVKPSTKQVCSNGFSMLQIHPMYHFSFSTCKSNMKQLKRGVMFQYQFLGLRAQSSTVSLTRTSQKLKVLSKSPNGSCPQLFQTLRPHVENCELLSQDSESSTLKNRPPDRS